MADDKTPSALAGILKRPTESSPGAENREAFQEARPRSREDIMLDIRLADGRIVTFSYTYFTRMDFTPGDTLRLRLPGAVVQIEGRRLARLRQTLTEHRTRFIQEGTEAEEGLKPEDAPHIDRIVIEEKAEE